MTASSPIAAPAAAQTRAHAAPFLRVGAGSALFGDLLAGRLGPDILPPEDDRTGSTGASGADEPGGAERETGPEADSSGPNESEGETADPGDPAHAGQASGEAASQHPATHAHTTAAIARELTHAATVDLAEVARHELVDPKSAKHQPPEDQGPLTLAPPPRPPITALGDPGQAPSAPAAPSAPGEPLPAPAAMVPAGKTPGPEAPLRPGPPPETPSAGGADVPRTSAAASAATPRVDPAAGVPADGRAALLQRLTGSAEAGRGAVAAPDRVGYQSVAKDPGAARPSPVTADAGPRQTREAVLNSVQRGLASVLAQGGGRMTVVLRPERLGEVRVRLDAKDGVVNARLAATTDAARRTLEAGLDTLRAALEARGVRVESLSVEGPGPSGGSPTGTGINPDARGEQGAAHDRGSGRRGGSTGGAPVGPAEHAEPEERPVVWTELGIDAVA